jgi:hypothetical protein
MSRNVHTSVDSIIVNPDFTHVSTIMTQHYKPGHRQVSGFSITDPKQLAMIKEVLEKTSHLKLDHFNTDSGNSLYSLYRTFVTDHPYLEAFQERDEEDMQDLRSAFVNSLYSYAMYP